MVMRVVAIAESPSTLVIGAVKQDPEAVGPVREFLWGAHPQQNDVEGAPDLYDRPH